MRNTNGVGVGVGIGVGVGVDNANRGISDTFALGFIKKYVKPKTSNNPKITTDATKPFFTLKRFETLII